jgi:hypothetical protein
MKDTILNLNYNNHFLFHKYINIKGFRYPKILYFHNKMFLFGCQKYKNEDSKVKYLINKYELDNKLDIILESKTILDLSKIIDEYFEDINLSSWVRNIFIKFNTIHLQIEIKFNLGNSFKHHNYLIETKDFIDFKILKKYDLDDYFLFYDINNNILSSKIITFKNEFWGKYLFEFKINNHSIIPQFDKIVNYDTDYGHILHNIIFDSKYIFIFSIRHKVEGDNNYIYKLYKSETENFKNFNNTEEIKTNHKEIDINFLSYPSYFKYNNEQYLICNQDEFGKSKNLVLFKNK